MARSRSVCVLFVLLLPVCLGAGLVDEYRFQGNLASSTGGAPLALVGEAVTYSTEVIDGETMAVAAFPYKTGFRYASPANRESYSLQMLLRLDDVSNYVKLIDFKNGASDLGLFVFAARLQFFGRTDNAGRFATDTWHEVTLTRDGATRETTIYLNGAKLSSFVDSEPDAALTAANGLGFLVSTTGGNINSSPGAIARILVHDALIVPAIRTPVRANIPCPQPLATRIPASERAALLEFYASTGGPNWAGNRHWGCAEGTECSWFGVGCRDSSNVGTIFLGGNLLDGSLPSSLANLKKLTYLYLSDNRGLRGAIPPELGSLGELEYLYLNGCAFESSIPRELGNLSQLVDFNLSNSGLSGPIPSELCNLKRLRELNASDNGLSGEIPSCLGTLTELTGLVLTYNQISGPIPESIGSLTKLKVFSAFGNRLSGEVPTSLGNLRNLEHILLAFNNLSGTIPPGVADMKELRSLWFAGNDLTGTIPSGIAGLTKLEELWLSSNRLTGEVPRGLDALTLLRFARLDSNQLSGTIPTELGNLTSLRELNLSSNLFEGGIPSALGNMAGLQWLGAARNRLRGEVPSSLLNLSGAQIRLEDNALTASDPALLALLESQGGFASLQTVAPTNVAVDQVGSFSARVRWTPIAYQHEPGGYQVLVSTTPGGPYTALVTTIDKTASEAIVTGLAASTRYYVVVKTVTYPHGGKPEYQLNTVFSDASAEVVATTLAQSATAASVILSAVPRGMVQRPGSSDGTDSYTLTNIGGTPAAITLAKTGSFFEHLPASFTLAPGESQIVVLSGTLQAEGEYTGDSRPSGAGVPAGLAIQVRLLVTASAGTGYAIVAERNRLDLIAPAGQDPSGTVSFRNEGTGAFTGVASSDVEFLLPPAGVITINAGQSVSLTVRTDRSKRPDAALLSGTQAGKVSLIGIEGFDARGRGILSTTSVSLVTVVDTVKPPTSASQLPPLVPGEIILFLTSVGHVVGSVGEFTSDLSILNAYGTTAAQNIKLFYTPNRPGATSSVATLSSVGSSQSVGLADVVKSVFDGTAEIGSLMIRSADTTRLSVSAGVFATSNPAGNYGTSIPVFRSDRSAAAGERLVITGLRKDDSGHTNFFLQETRGAPLDATLEFLNAAGSVVGSRSVTVPAFGMVALSNPPELQAGTAAVRITNLGGGGLAAYATPVDRASGDTWAVADWAKQYGYEGSEQVVIPVAGAVAGANGTFFQTDLAITNRCSEVVDPRLDPAGAATNPCTATVGRAKLRYYPQGGVVREVEIDLGLLQSKVMTDVVRTVFRMEPPTVGHLVFVPVSDNWALSSRTYNTVAGSPATYGSAVPALGRSTAIRPGQRRRIGGLQDSTVATISNRTPATNRTNFGIVETSGEPATVRLSVFYNDPKSLVAGTKIGERIFELAPNQFVSQSNVVRAVIGEVRETKYRDLTGVQVQFDVISATGAILVYTSSVDNGTSDSILRTE